eukprot:403351791
MYGFLPRSQNHQTDSSLQDDYQEDVNDNNANSRKNSQHQLNQGYQQQPAPNSYQLPNDVYKDNQNSNKINNKKPFNYEEGEVFMNEEDNPYIPMDPNFRFIKSDPLHKVNWRQINKIDFRQLRYGNCNINLQSAQTYEQQQQQSQGNPLQQMLMQVDDIAFCDLKDEKNIVWISDEGFEAMRVMQMSLQYLLTLQKRVVEKVQTVHSYTMSQKMQLDKLEQYHTEQKLKMQRYKKIDHKLNEQAIHFEIMINKLNKDQLKEKMEKVSIAQVGDPSELFTDKNIFNTILQSKGVIKEDQRETLRRLKDGDLQFQMQENQQINSNRSNSSNKSQQIIEKQMSQQSQNQEQNQQKQQENSMLMEIIESLKKIQQEINDIKQNPSTTMANQQQEIPRSYQEQTLQQQQYFGNHQAPQYVQNTYQQQINKDSIIVASIDKQNSLETVSKRSNDSQNNNFNNISLINNSLEHAHEATNIFRIDNPSTNNSPDNDDIYVSNYKPLIVYQKDDENTQQNNSLAIDDEVDEYKDDFENQSDKKSLKDVEQSQNSQKSKASSQKSKKSSSKTRKTWDIQKNDDYQNIPSLDDDKLNKMGFGVVNKNTQEIESIIQQKTEVFKLPDPSTIPTPSYIQNSTTDSQSSQKTKVQKQMPKKEDLVTPQKRGSINNNNTGTQHTPIQEEQIEEDVEDEDNYSDDNDFEIDDLLQSKAQEEKRKDILSKAMNLLEEEEASAHAGLGASGNTGGYRDESFVDEDALRGSMVESSLNNKDFMFSQGSNYDHNAEAKKFNNPIGERASEEDKNSKSGSIPDEANIRDNLDEEDDDEYKDDDFEQASQASGNVNVQGTLSQSGLPPLRSGKVNKSQTIHSTGHQNEDIQTQIPKKMSLLPSDFNLLESQASIDFDISESKGNIPLFNSGGIITNQQQPIYTQKKSSVIETLMRKKIDELNESGDFMGDSNDFAVSESNFSQSFRSRDAANAAKNSGIAGRFKQQQEKKSFYDYEQQKFSSYDKVNDQGANDDEF